MRTLHRITRLTGVLALAHAAGAGASTAGSTKVIAGWLEKVQVSVAADHPVTAKLDSGALTSSIHALDIESFQKDGEPWVRFDLVLGGKKENPLVIRTERPVTRHVRIKEHDGNHNRRPVVDLEFCFAGHHYSTQFSLVDRSQFNYSILLGRRFLAGTALIDSGSTFITEPGCTDPSTEASAS